MSRYDNNFFDDRDLIEHLSRGCEVEFLYHNKKYSITHIDEGISVIEYNNAESEKIYSNGRQVLEYEIENKKIKDIISDMKVIDRSF